jgi:C-terminal processing protease CtpA/Prc
MLEPLGDPYTRFLAPAQYQSLYGLATGEVAGLGVSLLVDEVSHHPLPTSMSSHTAHDPMRLRESCVAGMCVVWSWGRG